MNINKNISVWRGDNTPPTDYHLWIKSDGTSLIKVNNLYKVYYNPNIGDIINVSTLTDNFFINEDEVFSWVANEGITNYCLNLHTGVRILFREYLSEKWKEFIYTGLNNEFYNKSNWKLYNQEGKIDSIEENIYEALNELNSLRITKISPSDNSTLASYKLISDNNSTRGTIIDIPKDKTIKDVKLADTNATINSNGEIIEGIPKGSTALCIVYILENGTYKLVKLDYQSFLEEKEISDGLLVDNHFIKVKIDPTTEKFISVSSSGVKVSGLQDTVDKVKTIWSGNPDLVTPTLTGTWSVYNNSNLLVQPTPSFPLEFGYKAKYSGTWKWETNSTKKNPERTSGNWGTTLPSSGLNSTTYNSDYITSNTTILLTIYAKKKGLMVSGLNVLPASGEDSKTASTSVTFSNRIYYGNSTSKTPSESIIKSLTTKLGNKELNITNVTALLYYVYAYPKTLGKLNTIIQDGATPVLGAFTLIESTTITNAAGLSVPLYVYVSNNPGAFTNNTLNFK